MSKSLHFGDVVPVPFEQIEERLPAHLVLKVGENRKAGPSQLSAETDLEAVRAWLKQYEDDPQVHRSFRREAERVINWLLLEVDCPLSAATRDHIAAYLTFLSDPQPEKRWCAKKGLRRTDPAWRPFNRPLSAGGVEYARTVLGNLFGFLRDMDYLTGSPMPFRRSNKPLTETSWAKRQRSVPVATMNIVLAELVKFADAELEKGRKRERERALFVVRFLANTGLSCAELAVAKLDDFDTVPDSAGNRITVLHVEGLGARKRQVVIGAAAIDALNRYHAIYELPNQPGVPVFLNLSGSNLQSRTSVDQSVAYRVLREAFESVADALTDRSDLSLAELDHLRRTTPQSMRRTYATLCLERGIPFQHLQVQLGHRSATSTGNHQISDTISRHRNLSNFQL
ncbi:site-specific integrase [Paraburkholderia sediminicola]|uniref:tyrosine-type recombinase/integrase n=1 Tax=Paraburkholderia sediminicola TaxID=458836 RepID=UPI0038B9C926